MVSRYDPKPKYDKITRRTTSINKNIPTYGNFYKTLKIKKYEPRIREKFEKLRNLPHIFDKIDWKILESSLEGMTEKRKYVKTIWQLWYTRKIAFRENNI